MTRPIDEERRGTIDAAADATAEIRANTILVFCPELEFSSRKHRMRRDPTPDCEIRRRAKRPCPSGHCRPAFVRQTRGLQQGYFRKNSSQTREANAKLCTDGPI